MPTLKNDEPLAWYRDEIRASQRASEDRRHMMTLSFVWKPDYFDRYNTFVRTAFNGWTVTGIWTANSGQPFTVTTGVEKRDNHLKSPDFFDVTKFPKLSFKSTSISNAGGKLTLTGDLTLDGVTKSITLDVDGPAPAQTDAKGVTRSGFSATGKLKRSEFSFGTKSMANAAIGDDVKFSIDIEIDKK